MPSIEYSKPVPVGVLTEMLPVATKQVGWTVLAVGVAGVAGAALIVTTKAVDSQPSALRTVRL
ncbi:hypothetical protein D3C77_792150 [compost metagenome]